MSQAQRGRALGWMALTGLVAIGLGSLVWMEVLALRAETPAPLANAPSVTEALTEESAPRAVRLLDRDGDESAATDEAPVARPVPRSLLTLPSSVPSDAELGSPWDQHWASVRPRPSTTGVDLEITGPPDHLFVAFVGPGDSEVLLPVAAGRLDATGTATLPAIFPAESALRVPDLSPDRYYVVQEGDAPDDIARRFYGNEQLWRQMLRYNRFEWGDLRPGEVLVLPHPAPEDLPPGGVLDVNRRTVFVRLAIIPPGLLR